MSHVTTGGECPVVHLPDEAAQPPHVSSPAVADPRLAGVGPLRRTVFVTAGPNLDWRLLKCEHHDNVCPFKTLKSKRPDLLHTQILTPLVSSLQLGSRTLRLHEDCCALTLRHC